MKIMIRENEDNPWVEQEIVYHDGTVWFQVNGEFIIGKGKFILIFFLKNSIIYIQDKERK